MSDLLTTAMSARLDKLIKSAHLRPGNGLHAESVYNIFLGTVGRNPLTGADDKQKYSSNAERLITHPMETAAERATRTVEPGMYPAGGNQGARDDHKHATAVHNQDVLALAANKTAFLSILDSETLVKIADGDMTHASEPHEILTRYRALGSVDKVTEKMIQEVVNDLRFHGGIHEFLSQLPRDIGILTAAGRMTPALALQAAISAIDAQPGGSLLTARYFFDVPVPSARSMAGLLQYIEHRWDNRAIPAPVYQLWLLSCHFFTHQNCLNNFYSPTQTNF